MRTGIIACAALALAACETWEPTGQTSPSGEADAAEAVAALRPFYDRLDLPLPERPEGAAPPAEVATIVFGSCLDTSRPAPILSALAAADPDLVVMMGDNVYGDAVAGDATLPELRAVYQELAEREGFQAINAAAPILPVWDDHDYGINDGGVEFFAKEYAERIFLDFWRIPESDPRRARPGVYGSEMHGAEGRRVHVILLDTRYFRSPLKRTEGPRGYLPDPDPAKTLLGDAQWTWLDAELARPADLKLIVSSIQIIAEGHRWEKWANLPRERERLFDMIKARAAAPVVFASGDRHRAGIYRVSDAGATPIYELTASSLNRPLRNAEEEEGPRRVGATYWDENFGVMEIDWAEGALTLSVRDIDGAVVREQNVVLAAPGE